MWPETSETPQPLRSGLTTGSCATACSVAAVQALLAGKQPSKVEITLPKGKVVNMTIEGYLPLSDQPADKGMRTATIKDAGDDPDATHGATIYVELRLQDEPGVRFKAAEGVGTVTREGLALPVGEPAINRVPRKMMTDHLLNAAEVYKYAGGFEVSVGVERGETIALKTMNSRLGILGGLSILGTTGIVRPYSCAAYIASIHQGIDVATTNGVFHIAATTGSTSEGAITGIYDIPEMGLIEMGDFVGAVLKYLKKVPVERLTICGGFGKLTKLANGHLDLNSRASSIDLEHLANLAAGEGADDALQAEIKAANTSMQALKSCQDAGVDLASKVCEEAWKKAKDVMNVPALENLQLEIFAVDRKGGFVGCYPASLKALMTNGDQA